MDIESCIMEIKKAIARIEEQTRIIFNTITENRKWAEGLHKEHFDDTEKTRDSISELNIKVSRLDAELNSIKETISHLASTLEDQTKIIAKTRGIAVGLGMAGGAVVSILTIIAEILR